MSGQFAAELADLVLDHLGLAAPNDPEHLICRCDGVERESDQHAAHVAAVLREQIARWITLAGPGFEPSVPEHWEAVEKLAFGTGFATALVALTDALAAQVARVDPSRSESGSTDPEVRQSADRTSSPPRVPGEET